MVYHHKEAYVRKHADHVELHDNESFPHGDAIVPQQALSVSTPVGKTHVDDHGSLAPGGHIIHKSSAFSVSPLGDIGSADVEGGLAPISDLFHRPSLVRKRGDHIGVNEVESFQHGDGLAPHQALSVGPLGEIEHADVEDGLVQTRDLLYKASPSVVRKEGDHAGVNDSETVQHWSGSGSHQALTVSPLGEIGRADVEDGLGQKGDPKPSPSLVRKEGDLVGLNDSEFVQHGDGLESHPSLSVSPLGKTGRADVEDGQRQLGDLVHEASLVRKHADPIGVNESESFQHEDGPESHQALSVSTIEEIGRVDVEGGLSQLGDLTDNGVPVRKHAEHVGINESNSFQHGNALDSHYTLSISPLGEYGRAEVDDGLARTGDSVHGPSLAQAHLDSDSTRKTRQHDKTPQRDDNDRTPQLRDGDDNITLKNATQTVVRQHTVPSYNTFSMTALRNQLMIGVTDLVKPMLPAIAHVIGVIQNKTGVPAISAVGSVADAASSIQVSDSSTVPLADESLEKQAIAVGTSILALCLVMASVAVCAKYHNEFARTEAEHDTINSQRRWRQVSMVSHVLSSRRRRASQDAAPSSSQPSSRFAPMSPFDQDTSSPSRGRTRSIAKHANSSDNMGSDRPASVGASHRSRKMQSAPRF